MNIEYTAYQILLTLRGEFGEIDKIYLNNFKYSLENSLEEAARPQDKEFLMMQATTSGRNLFKLIGRVNSSGLELMEWCEDAQNFDGMCSSKKDIAEAKQGDYIRRTYSLKELPDVIDNALRWHNSVKADNPFRGTNLHILAVD